MNIIGIKGNSDINYKKKTYNPNFGRLVFSSQMAKDYFLKKVSEVPYKKRGLVKKLTELVYSMTTNPKKAVISGDTGLHLSDEKGEHIADVILCRFMEAQPFYLHIPSRTRKKAKPKPIVDTYYIDKLIEGFESITPNGQQKTTIKKMPPIEKLVEECPIEEQIPLHLKLIMEGKM